MWVGFVYFSWNRKKETNRSWPSGTRRHADAGAHGTGTDRVTGLKGGRTQEAGIGCICMLDCFPLSCARIGFLPGKKIRSLTATRIVFYLSDYLWRLGPFILQVQSSSQQLNLWRVVWTNTVICTYTALKPSATRGQDSWPVSPWVGHTRPNCIMPLLLEA
jgi:hypothetical protein